MVASRVAATDTREVVPGGGELRIRSATWADLSAVTETISLAFHDDPTWSWAFPDPLRRQQQYAVFWRFLIGGALRYPWVLMTEASEAAAILDPAWWQRDRRRRRAKSRPAT